MSHLRASAGRHKSAPHRSEAPTLTRSLLLSTTIDSRLALRASDETYKPAAKKVGLGDDAIPYDLRGSFASLLIWEARTMLEVAAQLGHSLQVCEQHYARVFTAYDPGERTSAAAAIQAAHDGRAHITGLR